MKYVQNTEEKSIFAKFYEDDPLGFCYHRTVDTEEVRKKIKALRKKLDKIESLIDEVENYRISEKLERDILEVPACEIKLAMIDILELQGSIKYDDIAHILASFFGIKALSQTNQEKLNKLIKYVILNSNEFIIKDNYLMFK